MDERELKLETDKSRADVLTESVKALLLVNGGGAVALLAFLQSIWSNTALARVTLGGIALMGAGLIFALLVQPFRFSHSKIVQRTGDRKTVFWFLYSACEYLSVLAFVAALALLVCGGLRVLAVQ